MKERLLDRLHLGAFRARGSDVPWALLGALVGSLVGWLLVIPFLR